MTIVLTQCWEKESIILAEHFMNFVMPDQSLVINLNIFWKPFNPFLALFPVLRIFNWSIDIKLYFPFYLFK